MLHSEAFITAPEDFPGLTVRLKRPGVKGWTEYQEMAGAGNQDEAQLNLLIACGSFTVDDTTGAIGKPANFGALCDDWPALPGLAFGELAAMAGTFAVGFGETVALDLAAVLAAAERVEWTRSSEHAKATGEDIALASVAQECGAHGLDADTMRTVIACNRAKRYAALLVPSIGAALVFRTPRFSAWAAFNRARRGDSQSAGTDFAASCCEHPGPAGFRALVGNFPAVSASSAAVCIDLLGNVKAEVGKGQPLSAPPAATPSSAQPA